MFVVSGEAEGPSSTHLGWVGHDTEFDGWSVWKLFGNYVTALFGSLFAYGGWEAVCGMPLGSGPPITWCRLDSSLGT